MSHPSGIPVCLCRLQLLPPPSHQPPGEALNGGLATPSVFGFIQFLSFNFIPETFRYANHIHYIIRGFPYRIRRVSLFGILGIVGYMRGS